MSVLIDSGMTAFENTMGKGIELYRLVPNTTHIMTAYWMLLRSLVDKMAAGNRQLSAR